LIGFGFRERDVAIDLVGNLQQFQKSIERELQAKNIKVKEIKKLGEGEKIHIDLGGRKKKSSIVAKGDANNGDRSGSTPLLKKPPTFVLEERDLRVSMGSMNLNAGNDGHSSSEESEGAVARSVVSDFGGFSSSDSNDDIHDWNDFQEADVFVSSTPES
jgi:hypothetical protein